MYPSPERECDNEMDGFNALFSWQRRMRSTVVNKTGACQDTLIELAVITVILIVASMGELQDTQALASSLHQRPPFLSLTRCTGCSFHSFFFCSFA